MEHMAVDHDTFEQQYREIFEKATQQQPGSGLQAPTVTTPETFFFPWEYSPYRTNGSTSAEGATSSSNK